MDQLCSLTLGSPRNPSGIVFLWLDSSCRGLGPVWAGERQPFGSKFDVDEKRNPVTVECTDRQGIGARVSTSHTECR